jgi:hypothetical protein
VQDGHLVQIRDIHEIGDGGVHRFGVAVLADLRGLCIQEMILTILSENGGLFSLQERLQYFGREVNFIL